MESSYFYFLCSLCIGIAAADSCFVVNMDNQGGTISPVKEGGRYPENQDCRYTIDQYAPYGLKLWFEQLDLEVDDTWNPCESDMYSCHNECDENDWIAILDAGSGNEICRRCGSETPGFIYRTSGSAQIWFHTDRNIQRTGFTIRFEIDPDTVPCQLTNFVEGSSAGTIMSYARESDGLYRNEEDCKWKLTVPSGYSGIKFTFTSLEVDGSCAGFDESCTCPDDWVAIYDGDSVYTPELTKRCGFSIPEMSFYATSQVAFIRFFTDHTVQYRGWVLTYEACYGPCQTTTTSTTTTTTTTTITRAPQLWPRDEALLAFWPLDFKNSLKDVSGWLRHCDSNCNGVVKSSLTGPFGDYGTSHHSPDSNMILTSSEVFSGSTSFTVSFFIRTLSSSVGGVLSFFDKDSQQVFGIELVSGSENRPFIKLRAGLSSVSYEYGPYDVIQPNDWSFVSIVFDGDLGMLSVQNRFGQVYMPGYKQAMFQTKGMAKGVNIGISGASYLQSSVDLSCVTIYSEALAISDVRAVHEACRVAHGTPPCGAPRLPYSITPPGESGTAAYGQFPYIAILRYQGEVKCSASIISPHYVILSNYPCLASSSDPSQYTITVGDYDYSFSEHYEKVHDVSVIFIDFKYGDFALLEVTPAIDLSNFYVNTICLDETMKFTEETNAYFYGWGEKGRSELAIQSTPRFVKGRKTSPSVCSEEWEGNVTTDTPYFCFHANADSNPEVPCNRDEGGPLLIEADTIVAENGRLAPVGLYVGRQSCSQDSSALFLAFGNYNFQQRIACNIPGYKYYSTCPIDYS